MAAAVNVLLVRCRSWVSALPVAWVEETMRPLPVQPIAGAAAFVRGVSIVRGAAAPVVDLAAILGVADGARGGRFVSIRSGSGRVLLEVDEVLGVRQVDVGDIERTPPLLAGAVPGYVEKMGSLDGGMLAVLAASRLAEEVLGAESAEVA